MRKITKPVPVTLTVPVTGAERQAAYKARQAEKGLIRLTGAWVHPDDLERVRKYLKRLNKQREH